jgi:hypothetical protein
MGGRWKGKERKGWGEKGKEKKGGGKEKERKGGRVEWGG